MSHLYELRVLSGCHAGASAPIQAGDLVGADLDCDIVLADDDLPVTPQAIGLSDGNWTLGDGGSITLNQPAAFGPVWITVAFPAQPWPQLPADAVQDAADDSEEIKQAADDLKDTGNSADDESATVVLGPEDSDPARHDASWAAQAAESRKGSRRYFYVMVLAVAVIALMMIVAVWRPGISTAEVDATASVSDAGRDSVEQILKVLQDLGHDDHVRIVVQDQGSVILQGWISTTSEKDAIATAMTRIWPMPALQLYVVDDVVDDVHRLLNGSSVYHEVSIQDEQIWIKGVVADQKQKETAISKVQHRYAHLDIVTDSLMPASVIRDRFVETLHHADAQIDVSATWAASYLEVDVRPLPDPAQDVVHKVAASFNHEYWGRVRVLGPDAPEPGLPFTIRSVVSGPQPYVVMPDGVKLLKGGRYQGYQLKSIEAGRLVFQGDDEVIVQR